MRKEIEDRLINFVVLINTLSEHLEPGYASFYLTDQISRSSMSAALNYGEAQAAESRKDFIHKTSLVLKELRETNINLKIIAGTSLAKNKEEIGKCLDESNQLVSIFHKALQSARKKTPI